MGWLLGLLGLTGTVWVIIKAVRGKAYLGELLALLWIILYFGPTGLFLAKFMRYMVPVVPLFTLFGAGLVIALWQYRSQGGRVAVQEDNEPITLPPSPNLPASPSPFPIYPPAPLRICMPFPHHRSFSRTSIPRSVAPTSTSPQSTPSSCASTYASPMLNSTVPMVV